MTEWNTSGSSEALAPVLTARMFDELWILTTLILVDAPMSGLAIANRVYLDTRFTIGRSIIADGYRLPRGRLYKILGQLVAQGYAEYMLVEGDLDLGESGRQKGYRLTPEGHEYYAGIRERCASSVMGGRRMLETLEQRVARDRPRPQAPEW